jgi:hypothetical protein
MMAPPQSRTARGRGGWLGFMRWFMALDIICPACGLDGRFPDELGGQQIVCPRCSTAVLLPQATAPVAPVVTAPDPKPSGADPYAVWVGDPQPGPVRHTGPAKPEDAAGHLRWLREETVRFNRHVAQQLEALQARRQRLLELEAQVESKCIAREQEVNRLFATVTSRAEAVGRREDEVARREADLAPGAAGLAARVADVAAREERLAHVEAEMAALKLQAEELRSAIAALEVSRDQAEAELRELTGRRTALVLREAALERGERAVQQRLAELDDLEERIRQELEGR